MTPSRHRPIPPSPFNKAAFHRAIWAGVVGLLMAGVGVPAAERIAPRLRVGVVQMALGATLEENRDRIMTGITTTAHLGARVAVFPEGALCGQGAHQQDRVAQAVGSIRHAAREAGIYVLFGGFTRTAGLNKDVNWMAVIDPEGRDIFRYEKLYDHHRAMMPGVFRIDGIPCSAIICADRWLRGVAEIPIQQGAQVSFELSCNFACEWVAPLEWYWYVPRAMRNGVWVVFANTGNRVSGGSDETAAPRELRHGHSAIIAPDGRIAAASSNDVQTVIVADLDLSQATRAAAEARSAHPALRGFWEAGLKLQRQEIVEAPPLGSQACDETVITIAAAQVTNDVAEMEAMVREARAQDADLIVFPERAVSGEARERLEAVAREQRITLVVGMEHHAGESVRNAAFVIGPDGRVLTRYDQLSATAPFQPGSAPATMWFRVQGVPAVVTIGRDALWTELAELAAVAGARIHVHLDHDSAGDREADLRRLQVWANLASYLTLTATVNVVGSTIWDDLRGTDETRAEVRALPRPETGPVEVYSPFSANIVVRATNAPQLIVARRRIPGPNPHHPRRTSNLNPQMDAWYRIGAEAIRPK